MILGISILFIIWALITIVLYKIDGIKMVLLVEGFTAVLTVLVLVSVKSIEGAL